MGSFDFCYRGSFPLSSACLTLMTLVFGSHLFNNCGFTISCVWIKYLWRNLSGPSVFVSRIFFDKLNAYVGLLKSYFPVNRFHLGAVRCHLCSTIICLTG